MSPGAAAGAAAGAVALGVLLGAVISSAQQDADQSPPPGQWGEHRNEPLPPGNQLADAGISDLSDPALRQAWENARGTARDKVDLQIDQRISPDLRDKVPRPDGTCYDYPANILNLPPPASGCARTKADLERGLGGIQYNTTVVPPGKPLPPVSSLPENTVVTVGNHAFIVKNGKLVEFTKPAPATDVPGRVRVNDSLEDFRNKESPRANFEVGPGGKIIKKNLPPDKPYENATFTIYTPPGTGVPATPPTSPPAGTWVK